MFWDVYTDPRWDAEMAVGYEAGAQETGVMGGQLRDLKYAGSIYGPWTARDPQRRRRCLRVCLGAHEYLVVSLGGAGFSKEDRRKQPGRQEENQEDGVPEDERGRNLGVRVVRWVGPCWDAELHANRGWPLHPSRLRVPLKHAVRPEVGTNPTTGVLRREWGCGRETVTHIFHRALL